MLCWFLLYNSINQLYVYLCPSPPLWASLPPSSVSPPGEAHHRAPSWTCYVTQQLPTSHLFYASFSHSVMSNSFRPHGLQHTRLPCPSLSPRDCSNSCPLSPWCHPTISSSVTLFSCPQSFPAPGCFLVSRHFTPGGQSIGASASVLPINIQVHEAKGKFGI